MYKLEGASKIDMLRPRRCSRPPYWNFCVRAYTPWIKYIYVLQLPFSKFSTHRILVWQVC